MLSLARTAWLVLAYNLAVIAWGAYVRATGSGAGCGAHWPLCDGRLVPRSLGVSTLIEYSHRITSGIALVSVVLLLVWVRRACPAGHPARRGATMTVVFMLLEAAVGAGLVLFELVADNASIARALFMAVHLTNTFILVAWMALTAWWLSGGDPVAPGDSPGLALGVGGLLTAVTLVGVSGAIAALGDTLFPSQTLAEALAADLSPTSHVLIRLRVFHPALAIATAVLLVVAAPLLARRADTPTANRLARGVAGLAVLQVVAGVVNVVLLAPVWMQLLHLLLADVLWITLVLLGAVVLRRHTSAVPARHVGAPQRA
ncbi:COX15/CtaA family protein [Luteitalea sp.]|uniref:COX15/CtaA family protein n=1 Tax=Luteitalea sp. TaxID=2004800 RepID=UPI0037CB11EF